MEKIMSKIKIRQVRSIIDRPKRQKLTIEALGLGRPNWEKVHNDTPQIRGMINKVSHLVVVEEYKEEKPKTRKRTSKKKVEKTEEEIPAANKE
jgi:large subunit ribosomal protein L30